MRPAFSVILLTTLIGVGQGLFVALYAAEAGAYVGWLPPQQGERFFAAGSAIALAFLILGLFASFFHLGRPERAWRAAVKWRTSWLSREVIALPAFMALVAAYGAAHFFAAGYTLVLGTVGLLLCMALFVCTGMIYAAIKFLQEWATPLTVVNFMLLGSASGFTFATAYSAVIASEISIAFCAAAAALTLASLAARVATLARNERLKPKSSAQTAIGVKHPRVVQKAQGFMGGSFNTREFFHGTERSTMRAVKWMFLALAFVVPLVLLVAGARFGSTGTLAAAFAAQYAGLIAERWFFFAQANHPQNLYYQAIS